MSTAAVILAAGASTRLGSPKQLITFNGETLLARAVRVAREAGCDPVVVILGASAPAILGTCSLDGARVVINADWAEGMAASIACGVAAVESMIEAEATGLIVMACDQPAVTAEHLQQLMARGNTTASGYAGRRGIPAFFPAAAFEDLYALHGDSGARHLLHAAHAIDLPGGELDIDRPEDAIEARQRFG